MAYSDKVVDHYEHPRNVGSFDKGDETVGTGMVGAPACGDVMKLQIKVNPETGLIEDARFKTYGCGSAIASSSLVTEWVKGKTLDEAAALKNSEIAEELGIEIGILRLACIAETINRGDGRHWIAPVYEARITSGEPKILEPEKHRGWGWFDCAALPSPLTMAAVSYLSAIGKQSSVQ